MVKKYLKRRYTGTFTEEPTCIRVNSSEEESSSEDEYGNVKDLIDYKTAPPKRSRPSISSDDESDLSESTDEETAAYMQGLSPSKRQELKNIERELTKYMQSEVPLKVQILTLAAPIAVKAKLLQRYRHIMEIGTEGTDYGKIRSWIDLMLGIPWGQYLQIPVTIKDGYQVISKYLTDVRTHLDQTIFGHAEPKATILSMVAQWIINPESKGLVLGFEGPPGTGKTSIMRDGVAYALQRPFVSIPLGGARDGAILDGSNQVFEGSTCGRIVGSIIEKRCMNPIFYLDELDKVSTSDAGAEIQNVLVHLTDPSQNMDFQDKFIQMGLDLSQSVFIFSYNDYQKIDPILRDRIKRVHFSGYSLQEKVEIAAKFSIPKILKEWGFSESGIVFSDDVIRYIVRQVPDEPGLRGVVHCLETIVSKMNLVRLTNETEFHKYFENSAGHSIKLTQKMLDLLMR